MIDTKSLRQKVLDLAIRGKLVPQDPNDEPASVLLERIRAQKQQMVKDGKLKAKEIKNDTVIFVGEDNLHYEKFADGSVKCIEDEIPFELPAGWAWVKMDTIAFVTKLAGFEYTKNVAPNLCKKGVPLFKGKNIQDGKIIYDFESYIPESVSDELCRSQITRKCILTPYVGTIGNIAIHNKTGKYHLGSNVGKIELYNETYRILEEYIVIYLRSQCGNKQLTKHIKATAQASISIEAIRDVYIPLPPSNEQELICEQINSILQSLGFIDESKKEISTLTTSAKSKILDLAIRGQLVPQDPNDEPAYVLLEHIRAEKEKLIKQGKIKRDKKESVIFKGEDNSYYEKIGDECLCIDDSIPFDIPDGWEWIRLGTIIDIERGGSPRPIKAFITTELNGVNWIKIGDVEKGGKYIYQTHEKIKPEGKSKSREVFPGDFLLTNSMSFGRPYISKINGCIHDGWLVLRNPDKAFDINYLYYLLSSKYVFTQFTIKASGSTVDNLNIDKVSDAIIPLPPLSEQSRIADEIEHTLGIVEQVEASLS